MKASNFVLLIFTTIMLSCTKKEAGKTETFETEPIESETPLSSSSYDLINSIVRLEKSEDQIRILDSIPEDDNTYEFIYDKRPALKNHLQGAGTYTMDASKIPNVQVIPSSSIDFNKPYQENKNVDPFWLIYSPLFSEDGKTAIISIDMICFGLCGEGWTLLLQKENNSWIVIEKFYRWIS